jgi:hypothetical protein
VKSSFARLQEAIIRISDDESILAHSIYNGSLFSPLALDPSCFQEKEIGQAWKPLEGYEPTIGILEGKVHVDVWICNELNIADPYRQKLVPGVFDFVLSSDALDRPVYMLLPRGNNNRYARVGELFFLKPGSNHACAYGTRHDLSGSSKCITDLAHGGFTTVGLTRVELVQSVPCDIRLAHRVRIQLVEWASNEIGRAVWGLPVRTTLIQQDETDGYVIESSWPVLADDWLIGASVLDNKGIITFGSGNCPRFGIRYSSDQEAPGCVVWVVEGPCPVTSKEEVSRIVGAREGDGPVRGIMQPWLKINEKCRGKLEDVAIADGPVKRRITARMTVESFLERSICKLEVIVEKVTTIESV